MTERKLIKFILSSFIIVVLVFSIPGVIAPSHPDNIDFIIEDVDTIIYYECGSIDGAIASSISHDMGIPSFCGEHDLVHEDFLTEFKDDGLYANVNRVVILGGEAVVPSEVQQVLDIHGEVVGGYDTYRIEGTTATGTAVEAIEYFYGPEMLQEVTLVAYEGDSNSDYNEVLHLAAESDGGIIIPVPSDANGLPAEVVETLDTINPDESMTINIIGDFEQEAIVKDDIQEIGAVVETEIDGTNPEVVEEQVEELVIENIQPGESVDIVYVEEGSQPPVVQDEIVIFYTDENNDGIDDESGSALDDIGVGLYNELIEKGASVDDIKCTGSHTSVWADFEVEIEGRGELVEVVEYTNAEDLIGIELTTDKEQAEEISNEFKEEEDEWAELAEQHKAEFGAALPSMIEQFKAYYIEIKDTLSPEALELANKIIDEGNKGDSVAQWQLMHAFANSYEHEEYVENCHTDEACRNEHVEMEYLNTEDALVEFVGTDRAGEITNLDFGTKVKLLGMDDFVPPTPEEESAFKADITEILATGASIESLPAEYVNEVKGEAYSIYAEELKSEYEAAGRTTEAAALTPEEVARIFDDRLVVESEAYLSGLVSHEDFADPAKRAETMAKMESIHSEFESKGVTENYYLTPEYWKEAYNKYTTDGTLPENFVKECEAAVSSYRTWEEAYPGVSYDPRDSFYNAKTGQFSYTDHENRVVSGVYDGTEGTYTFTNENGELVQGTDVGEVNKYTGDYGGWTFDKSSGSWKGPGGETYIPPSVYNPVTGTYDYHPSSGEHSDVDGYIYQWGSKGLSGGIYTGPGSAWTAPEGWTQSSDGTWTSSDGQTYSASTSYYSHSGSEGFKSSGEVWTQSSDGTWTSSGGATYSGYHDSGSYSYVSPSGESYSGGTYSGSETGTYGPAAGTTQIDPSGNTWTQSSDGTWTSSTGETSSVGTSTGGTTTSGTTDSGGGSAPSGGDGGGGMTGHAIYDSSLTRSWLGRWLLG